MDTYSKRQWLNKADSPSTGSIVSYHGIGNWCKDGKEETEMFLEIKDCHQSARLHAARRDTTEDFIEKMKMIRDHVSRFVIFLEDEYLNEKNETNTGDPKN